MRGSCFNSACSLFHALQQHSLQEIVAKSLLLKQYRKWTSEDDNNRYMLHMKAVFCVIVVTVIVVKVYYCLSVTCLFVLSFFPTIVFGK